MDNKQIELSLKTIFKGMFIVLFGNIIGYLLNLIFKVIVARNFGPEDYGWFSLALAIVIISANISGIGMNQGVARFTSFFKQRNELDKVSYLIYFGIKFSLIISLIIGLVIFMSSPWISKLLHGDSSFVNFLRLFALVIPFEIIFDYSLGILRGMKDMKMMALSNNVILWIVRLVFLGLIVIVGLDIQWMILPYFSSYLISLTLIWIYIRRKTLIPKSIFRSSFSNEYTTLRKEFISYSIPLALSTITKMFRKRFDVLLVGFFLTASQVGLYNVALSLAMLMTVFLFAINRIAMPVASSLFGEGLEVEISYIYKFSIMFFFSEKIVYILYGGHYLGAVNALRILSLGFFINSISGSFGEFLQSFGKTKPIFFISATGTLINIVLMVLLIPVLGIKGAALSLTLSLVYMCVLGNLCMYKYKKLLPFSKQYFYTLFLGAALFTGAFLITFIIPVNKVNLIFIGVITVSTILIYVSILYFFSTNQIDRKIMLALRKRFFSL